MMGFVCKTIGECNVVAMSTIPPIGHIHKTTLNHCARRDRNHPWDVGLGITWPSRKRNNKLFFSLSRFNTGRRICFTWILGYVSTSYDAGNDGTRGS